MLATTRVFSYSKTNDRINISVYCQDDDDIINDIGESAGLFGRTNGVEFPPDEKTL
ncbi:15872_t:CDS:2 [Entrophospora sp. SA101]|nr:15872_t:CDS:2 [Entrophospora sp. SA101]